MPLKFAISRCAGSQLLGDGAVAEHVELEPGWCARGGGRNVLDTVCGQRARDQRRAGPRGRSSGGELAVRVREPLERRWREQHRRAQRLPQQLHRRVDSAYIHQHARPQHVLSVGRAVRVQRDLVLGPARVVVEDLARQHLLREPLVAGDVGRWQEAGFMLRLHHASIRV
jgi:hypothetical protein